MKVNLQVLQHDLTTDQTTVLFDDASVISVNDRAYMLKFEEDLTKALVEIKFDEFQCEIIRKSDLSSKLLFINYRKTLNKVDSVYGSIEVMIYTNKYEAYKHGLKVGYDVIANNEIVDSYELTIKIEEVHDE